MASTSSTLAVSSPVRQNRPRALRSFRACARVPGLPRPRPADSPPPRPRYPDTCLPAADDPVATATSTAVPSFPQPNPAASRFTTQGSSSHSPPVGSFALAPRHIPARSARIRRLVALRKFDRIPLRILQQGWTPDGFTHLFVNPALKLIQLIPTRTRSVPDQPLDLGSKRVPHPFINRSSIFPQSLPSPVPFVHERLNGDRQFMNSTEPPPSTLQSIPHIIASRPSIALHQSPACFSLAVTRRQRKSAFPWRNLIHRSVSPHRRSSPHRVLYPKRHKHSLSTRCVPRKPDRSFVDLVVSKTNQLLEASTSAQPHEYRASVITLVPTQSSLAVAKSKKRAVKRKRIGRRRKRGMSGKQPSANASEISATTLKNQMEDYP